MPSAMPKIKNQDPKQIVQDLIECVGPLCDDSIQVNNVIIVELFVYNCRCCVNWDDNSEQNCTSFETLQNCQMIHEYPKDEKKYYRISVTYCNYIKETDICCNTLTKFIYASD